MKKVFLPLILIISLMFSLCLTSCDSEKALVEDAIEILEEHWEESYEEDLGISWSEPDGHFEIKNTRVIKIKDNIKEDDKAYQYFGDVEYVIEFVLFTDYLASAPYYKDYGLSNSVLVYEDGDLEVSPHNLFDLYKNYTYSFDYSEIIDEIVDYGDKFNCVKKLK